ncbi:hypothetical protein PHYBLDRAFT_62555 [Phycomyces blakesleeanus NRRL 1555(-)]|uniref:Uncharacterized protein n=1 Tax=Phycomyces blakesleeanus (strain ATCC 8743b / DSM 1359 / FGSC 10004 / NBRC 33097 / NRRL 1555) TaxID=763407 RepID=A0A163EHM4_PHYB8|nr:hypothetical protein PHYBLDRAFT_62555 [Phycomyces blakesleeanus NRRL 1555(-)]OAD78690.1 hypothetical protein PHYBLDRAFT_62555 [Phycomyces blakesleeanus NRRL 1555(-)]|eukprot:XP_018296730.1 hypothetical protein PHYBLDRAFT_62555 [Phycomyces blakesleeanus NRRL 1555(-)]
MYWDKTTTAAKLKKPMGILLLFVDGEGLKYATLCRFWVKLNRWHRGKKTGDFLLYFRDVYRYINYCSRRIAEEQEEHPDDYEDREPTAEEIQQALAQYAQDYEQEEKRVAVSLHYQGCLDPSTFSDEDSKLLFRFTPSEV